MDNISSNREPRLVQTGGDSPLLTVQYKGRFLYSKYNPARAICSIIEKTTFLPGTIILACSPCLWYGLDELTGKLPENCTIVAVEYDTFLCNIAKQKRQDVFSASETAFLDTKLRQLASTGLYRRVVRIDFSAGTVLAPDFYTLVTNAAEQIVATFWFNRITLVKMGRLFTKNLFQNLPSLAEGPFLQELKGSVSRPILVCGAGESLDSTPLEQFGSTFVIAVDAAVPSLVKRGIRIDAVVALEGQFVIQKAYIGCERQLKKTILIADIASRPSVLRAFHGRTVWMASRFTEAAYLDSMKEQGIIQNFVQPMGSVGLAAAFCALVLRETSAIPVYITGMDFSYSIGRTHARGTPAQDRILSESTKLSSSGNYGAAFSAAGFFVSDKNGDKMATGKAMKSYADNFAQTFSQIPNMYDIGEYGIPLGLQRLDASKLCRHISSSPQATGMLHDKELPRLLSSGSGSRREKLISYCTAEQQALLEARDLLVNGEASKYRNEKPLDEQLASLLAKREYLYLHFPDGYRFSPSPAFLKRVRAELDYFLKQMQNALSQF